MRIVPLVQKSASLVGMMICFDVNTHFISYIRGTDLMNPLASIFEGSSVLETSRS
jgi:hypothetical protein